MADLEKCQSKRISFQQREAMLQFMQEHPAFGTGKITAPDGYKLKQTLLLAFAERLNSMNGVIKTPDKWLKSWQDWRSDTKAKAAMVGRFVKAGSEPVSSSRGKTLTALEEELLSFLDVSVKRGYEEVTDPLFVETSDNGQDIIHIDCGTIILPLDLPESSTAPILSPLPMASLPQSSSLIPSLTPSSSDELISQASPALPQSQSVSDVEESKVIETKKRRRQSESSSAESDSDGDGSRLVALTERQVEIQAQGVQIAAQQLQLQERQTVAFESASIAFCAAMKALESFLSRKSDSATNS